MTIIDAGLGLVACLIIATLVWIGMHTEPIFVYCGAIFSLIFLTMTAGWWIKLCEVIQNRQTLRLLPDCQARMKDRQDQIAALLCDFIESEHTPGAEWDGRFFVHIQPTPSHTQVWASPSLQDQGWRVSPAVKTAVHQILFGDTAGLKARQRRLWNRWVQEHRYWEHHSPRYTAHGRLAAHRRLLDRLPLSFLKTPSMSPLALA